MDIEARERACLELLQKLPIDEYVLIGGYAASSFDFPRFSVDLDIVIDKKKEKPFVKIILESGFAPIETNVEPVRDIYGGRFLRFEKEDVKANVDLLINSVISRQTGSSYSFGHLLRHSEIREVVGFSGKRIPSKESLGFQIACMKKSRRGQGRCLVRLETACQSTPSQAIIVRRSLQRGSQKKICVTQSC